MSFHRIRSHTLLRVGIVACASYVSLFVSCTTVRQRQGTQSLQTYYSTCHTLDHFVSLIFRPAELALCWRDHRFSRVDGVPDRHSNRGHRTEMSLAAFQWSIASAQYWAIAALYALWIYAMCICRLDRVLCVAVSLATTRAIACMLLIGSVWCNAMWLLERAATLDQVMIAYATVIAICFVLGCQFRSAMTGLVAWLYGRTGRCPKCGYDLWGNVSGTCPECGLQQSGAKMSAVPENRRKQ